MFALILLILFFGFGILQAQLQSEVRNIKTASNDVDEAEHYYYGMILRLLPFINFTRFTTI